MLGDGTGQDEGKAELFEDISRRRVLSAAAVVGVAGGGVTLVGAQETGEIELEGYTGGWEGVAPSEIEGQTNPTLSLEAGTDYTLTWTNEDGAPHNFALLDADENVIQSTEIINEGSQTVEFTASEEMAIYICEVHPQSMRGEIQTAAGTDTPTATDTPEQTETPDETETPDDGGTDLPREFHAHLLGEPHGIETEGSGEATFTVSEDTTEVQYTVTVQDICNVTQAHIHLGGEGESGPVVAWLYPEEGQQPQLVDGRFSGTLVEGTLTADDLVGDWGGTSLEAAVNIFNEEGAYVNVHTEEHPAGEIRGQIMPPHD